MLINGLQRGGSTYESDVCIVGSGAAGLTLALELANAGVSVVMVESGAMNFQWRSHKLLDVDIAGMATERLVQHTRERFFGGTTNHWGGVCRPLSAFEFEHHDWVPHSGWPISRKTMEPYYVAARDLLQLPELQRDFEQEASKFVDQPRLASATDNAIEPVIWRRVAPQRRQFGRWRLDEAKASAHLRSVINTTITQIHPDASGQRVEYLEGKTFNNEQIQFRAKDYVLCTGALENPRLLLASNSVVPTGIGNEHDQVGRYFMDHPGDLLGQIVPLSSDYTRSQEELLSDSELVGWFTSETARREKQLLGFQAFLVGNTEKEPLHAELGFRHLINAPQGYDLADVGISRQAVLWNWEQAPNPDSRIMLSDSTDSLGNRRPLVRWNVTDLDLYSARKNAELFSIAVAKSGRARIYLQDILSKPLQPGGGHQIGTTRMSNDPRHGVTDPDGRVHSMDNLFVGGSSLFPTGGWQHPTFTIVALALRQAEHLAARATS